MGFISINKPPAPTEVREQFPLAPELAEIKHAQGEEIKKIFTGENDRLVVIIGPCSADNEESVYDYAGHPVKVQEKTKNRLTIVLWVYTDKPRTTNEGYVGVIYQPDPEKRPDMSEGILVIRHMHTRVLWETSLPTADETLYPENMNYLSDMMPYVAVGARSMENQLHRLVANGCNVPVDVKDLTNGDLTVILNSVVVTQLPHNFVLRDFEVRCPGNPLTRIILRGAVNKGGQCAPDYHYEDLKLLFDLYNRQGLQNPACIMDTNHANSNKQYQEQIRIAKEVLHSRRRSGDIKNLVKGLMVESYIEPGNQKIGGHCCDKPTTDPCLGQDGTGRPLYETTDNLD